MGKRLLTESLTIQARDITKISINEEYAMFESDKGEKVRSIGAFTFPISRPDQENLNGRIYTSKLWENVIKKKMGEGAFGLTDHPDDGGSVKDAFCVWRNLRIGERNHEKVVLADAYLFGTWGRHAKDAIDAGGSIGLSSVGYGDFMEDGKTIGEDYELVRPSDWVLDPSYQVFGGKADEISQENTDEPAEEAPSRSETAVKLDEVKPTAKSLEEKSFRIQIKSVLDEIKDINNVVKKQKELEETLSFFVGVDYAPDLREEVLEELKRVDSTIKEATVRGLNLPKDILETVDKLETEIKQLRKDKAELQKENTAISALLNSMKRLSAEMKEQVEKSEGQLKTLFSIDEVAEIEERYKEDLDASYDAIETYQEQIEKLKKEMANIKAVLEAEVETKHFVIQALETQKDEFIAEENKWLAVETIKLIKQFKAEKDIEIEEARKLALKDAEKIETYTLRKDPVIQAYYNELISTLPELAQYKEDILACHTLVEAQKKVLGLKKEIYGTTRESFMEAREEPKAVNTSNGYTFTPVKKKPINNLPLREGWL